MEPVIVWSYRGPRSPGGVSSAMERICALQGGRGGWLYMAGDKFMFSTGVSSAGDPPEELATLEHGLVADHYQRCNEELWPDMHDMFGQAIHSGALVARYGEFSRLQVKAVAKRFPRGGRFFVQDYQYSEIPGLLREELPSVECSVFWHIPWFKADGGLQNQPDDVLQTLRRVAEGLLGAQAIGFHTREYAENFLAFVRDYVGGFDCDDATLRLVPQRAERRFAPTTQLVVAPLGIDYGYWKELARGQVIQPTVPMPTTRFVLSVDRTDYTKGVLPRMEAIEIFFDTYRELVGEVTFLFLGQPTRNGIQAYREYWDACKEVYRRVNARWERPGWQPILWHEGRVEHDELAQIYRASDVAWICPFRDGLNLTALEWATCQRKKRGGVLCLSPGAGAYQQLNPWVMPINAGNPAEMARIIHQALAAHGTEWARVRMVSLKEAIKAATIDKWWATFRDASLASTEHMPNEGEEDDDM